VTPTPPFDPDGLDEVRTSLGVPAPPETAPEEAPAPLPPPVGAKQKVKRVVKRVAGPFLHQVAVALTTPVTDLVSQRLYGQFEGTLTQIQADLEMARAELRLTVDRVEAVRGLEPTFAVMAAAEQALNELHSLSVNLELMKGELAETHATLDDVGAAIAPGAGIIGIADRFTELRQQVNALARQLRSGPAGSGSDAPAGDRLDASPVRLPPSFDYVGLERRFRGESAEILAEATERYLPLLRDHQPVLDVGCGRGELLGALAELGIEGSGVDLDAGMVEQARADGVDAHHGDAIEFLHTQPEATYGAIVSIQVVEHLPFDVLMDLVDLAVSRLRPGGVLVLETPNPQSLFVLGNTFLLDPTHVRPIHPSLLVFLCERAGFADIDLRFEAPLTSHHLQLLDEGPDTPAWIPTLNQSLRRLNDTLFGPQDYAVIARTSGSGH
jgi:2-polyprenyl-3-methyl-5-hydroxy-6-metoxy-1,4-benzoquinol methylase